MRKKLKKKTFVIYCTENRREKFWATELYEFLFEIHLDFFSLVVSDERTITGADDRD
jgi:hypothetical protein